MNPPTHVTPTPAGLVALRCYINLRLIGVSRPVAIAISKAYLPSRPSLPAPRALGSYDRITMRRGLMV